MYNTKPEVFTIKDVKVTDYETRSVEKRNSGSGDSAKLLHSHSFYIGDEKFSFLAIGHVKWIYATDTVSFDYTVKDGIYNNIIKKTITTKDKDGSDITRGDRRFKTTLRNVTFGRDK